MPDDLLIARNPDADSTPPYLVRVPVGRRGIVVKARRAWPGESKVYGQRASAWRTDAETLEWLPVRLPGPPATNADIRGWVVGEGLLVGDRGRIPAAVREACDRCPRL